MDTLYDMPPGIRVTAEGEIRLITLDRPEDLNASTTEMLFAFPRLFDNLARDPGARVAILTGAGRAFSAGGDFNHFVKTLDDADFARTVQENSRRTIYGFIDVPIPIIAAANGAAVGWGATLATLCDIVLISEKAFIAEPHINIGLVLGDGISVAWPLYMSAGLAIETDVTRRADVERAVEQCVERFGGLDILIHNANASGDSSQPVNLEDVSEERWDSQARVSWDGAFHCAQVAFPHLKRSGRGRVIIMGSAFGLHGDAMNPTYASLKGADRSLVKALAREWGPYGITVNAVEPASATEPTKAFFAQNPALHDSYLRNFPMRRMGEPRADIGRAIVAICSEEFGYVTAQSIQVDGGLYTAL